MHTSVSPSIIKSHDGQASIGSCSNMHRETDLSLYNRFGSISSVVVVVVLMGVVELYSNRNIQQCSQTAKGLHSNGIL